MIDSRFWGVGSGDADYLGWAGTVEKKCKCQWNCLLHLPRTKKVAYYKRLIQDRELRRPWGPAMKATGIHTAEPNRSILIEQMIAPLKRLNATFFVAFDLKLITNNWYKGQKSCHLLTSCHSRHHSEWLLPYMKHKSSYFEQMLITQCQIDWNLTKLK